MVLQNAGHLKMGSVGSKRWVMWQDKEGRAKGSSCNGAAGRCSSFLDRNGGQIQQQQQRPRDTDVRRKK